ncbi:hypothetical protein HC031_04860 [Planosporangium thailandense]|uniref:DUF4386 family protein n=1 Tax=Planosporangium thailandense TaxID=765197 RepID=A0ABX0XTB0_9ACTN|nr:hypothetical protein [Planosporangium thailandense]NJC69056.1 hypothetical protein [Planosporangium thailandense]
MTENRSRLPLAGVLAGLTFGAGLFTLFTIPGGGDVTDQQITDFYHDGGRRATALGLYFVLVVGSWLMTWFFTELAARLEPGAFTGFVRRMAAVGTAAVIVGGAIALAPSSVQMNSGRPFVGVAIAQTFAHAGLLVAIVGGVFSFAATTFAVCLRAPRTRALPGWVAVSGMVVAVLLLTSFVVAPAVLLPLWVIVAGLGTRRAPAAAHGPVTAHATA